MEEQASACSHRSTFYPQLSPQGSLSGSKMLQGYAYSEKV